jgi:hypothetical protein
MLDQLTYIKIEANKNKLGILSRLLMFSGSSFSETLKTLSNIGKIKIRTLPTSLQQWAISGLN